MKERSVVKKSQKIIYIEFSFHTTKIQNINSLKVQMYKRSVFMMIKYLDFN